ncbi:MAG: hypothetical protein GY859_04620, partial [Desulfobacterales bacterium]|nr:hypothetical protein [Desulfobacterales bacterium]
SVSLGVWTGVDQTPPTVQLSHAPEIVNVGDVVTFTLYAADNVGVIAKTLTVNGSPLPLVNNRADYQVTETGQYTAEASASDAAGLTGADAVSFYASDPNDHTPPIVTLDATDCQDVTDVTSITGSVTDEGPVYYGLYIKEQGGSDWRALANGQSQEGEINGELGQLDPTNLRNGVYDLMLFGLDIAGNSSMNQGCIFVDGGMKIGVVNLPAQDMSVPAPGFPLGLEREY